MSELDDFLIPTLDRQLEAEQALINGDPGPRLAMWSTQDPVTVFGAEKSVIGSEEARQAFRWLASRFSNCTDYRFELVAAGASGDLAYTLGYEHITFSMDGGPVAPITLRVTHVYRREDGEWKIVHRHADVPPTGQPFALTHQRSRHHGHGDRLRSTILVSTQHPRPGNHPIRVRTAHPGWAHAGRQPVGWAKGARSWRTPSGSRTPPRPTATAIRSVEGAMA
jgi:ketosteroid isomerase-like protein